jgi:hypothetical protein
MIGVAPKARRFIVVSMQRKATTPADAAQPQRAVGSRSRC